MTAEKDPRIEAVAKLLFTGPLCRQRIEDWGKNEPNFFYDLMCMSVAEDVLRWIDEAAAKDMLAKNRAAIDYELSVEDYYQRHVRGQKAPE